MTVNDVSVSLITAKAVEAMEGMDEAQQIEFMNQLRRSLHLISPQAAMPVDCVQWVPIDKVEPNDYNPNSVAPNEMKLLHTSISHDGYTQPVVAIWDEEKQKYVIVDGFHRYTTCRIHDDIQGMTKGCIPLVVIEKSINDRMASTVRHNRARGKHSVDGMADMIFSMLDEGWDDLDVIKEIGCTAEELDRLKHKTGFSKYASGWDWSQSWVTGRMAKFKREHEKGITSGTNGADTDSTDEIEGSDAGSDPS